jgi:predicted transcriptional regulator
MGVDLKEEYEEIEILKQLKKDVFEFYDFDVEDINEENEQMLQENLKIRNEIVINANKVLHYKYKHLSKVLRDTVEFLEENGMFEDENLV